VKNVIEQGLIQVKTANYRKYSKKISSLTAIEFYPTGKYEYLTETQADAKYSDPLRSMDVK
jgi:hypothetical protein